MLEKLGHNRFLAVVGDYVWHFANEAEAIASLQATLRRGPLSLGEVEETAAFVALLLAAYQNPNIYVITTMRSDFIGDCAAFYGLPEAVSYTPILSRTVILRLFSYKH